MCMLRYADDIAVQMKNNIAMGETLLNEQTMKINTVKTNVLVCIRNNNIRTWTHPQNNREIDQVEESAYLRSVISEDGTKIRE